LRVNIIVLWQTVYTQAALEHLAANGYPLDPRRRGPAYPLGHPTINLDGRYRTPRQPPTTGLRPLRTDLLRILYRSSSQAGLADNPSVRIEDRDGRDHLVLTGLDRLGEPGSLTELRADVDARIPIVDLPEALLEVHSWTGCPGHFTHVSGATSRQQDMIISVAAALTASAMNVGMRPMVQEGNEALTLDRLYWVEQNYIRAATLTAANAALAGYHSWLPLVAHWGGGELASADGRSGSAAGPSPSPRELVVSNGLCEYGSNGVPGIQAHREPESRSAPGRRSRPRRSRDLYRGQAVPRVSTGGKIRTAVGASNDLGRVADRPSAGDNGPFPLHGTTIRSMPGPGQAAKFGPRARAVPPQCQAPSPSFQ
jgi:Tn3 transposase DDE domain